MSRRGFSKMSYRLVIDIELFCQKMMTGFDGSNGGRVFLEF